MKNTGGNFQHPLARARGHLRSCSLNRNEPGDAIETTRNSFFDNKTIFVFITSRSRANSTTLISQNTPTCVYKCLKLKLTDQKKKQKNFTN